VSGVLIRRWCIDAVDALGAENVQGVSMPGPFSSEGSKQDAANAGAEPRHQT